jgi:hypothetical protein
LISDLFDYTAPISLTARKLVYPLCLIIFREIGITIRIKGYENGRFLQENGDFNVQLWHNYLYFSDKNSPSFKKDFITLFSISIYLGDTGFEPVTATMCR